MRLALLTDSHWGCKNSSPIFLDYFKKFYDNVFFPYMDKHNIKTMIHLGDLVDSRKAIGYLAAESLQNIFLTPLKDRNIDSHFIVGNHDLFFRNKVKPNSLDILIRDNYDFKVYEHPKEVVFDSLKILLLPWICDENSSDTYELIKSTDAQVAMGHLELAGFEFYRGIIAHEGESANIYKRFDKVFSGHYHQGSSKGNITYLGAPCHFTWADAGCDRGFHIFDTETRELQFIHNPYKMFHIIEYDEDNTLDVSQYKDAVVKVKITNKKSQSKYDEFISSLDNSGLNDYSIIPESSLIVLDDSIPNIELETTINIIKHYIDELDDTIDKVSLTNLMTDVYHISLNQQGKL